MCSVVDPRDFEQRFVYHRQPSSSDFSLLVFLLKSFMKRFFSRGGYFHYRPIQPQDGALLLITTSTFRPLGLVSDQSLSCEVFDVLFRFQGRNCKTDKRVSVRGGFSRSSKTAERSELKVVFFFSVHFFWQATASASPKTRRSPPTSRSWWVSTSRTASWTCCTTNGTRWCPVGNAASPWRR